MRQTFEFNHLIYPCPLGLQLPISYLLLEWYQHIHLHEGGGAYLSLVSGVAADVAGDSRHDQLVSCATV